MAYSDMNKQEICDEIEELTGEKLSPRSYNRDELLERLVEAEPDEATEPEVVTYIVAKGQCIMSGGKTWRGGDEIPVELVDDYETFRNMGVVE